MSEKLIRDFMMLWATIDPIGTLSLFLGVTAAYSAQQRKSIALRCIAYSAIILLATIIVGQLLLDAMGISLPSFQIAGSAILFLFGLQMIFGSAAPKKTEEDEPHDVAVFPLAIPSIASPGAIMAVTLATDNDQFEIVEQAATAVTMLLVLAITGAMLLAAERIHRAIGNNGAAILVRVMGMILAALATESLIEGITLALAAQ
ncbi:hypothetical protein Mal52_17990 [Symmachiella dynata]|uniref:UPF0056 membrane protein n=1 Tax=Symmachiella dynata TaxID=2527995 RepID=A0A517ZLI9_9PLAN|nr:MarC family protein [Symmachiella dynata]QDU43327.1 hypothetical protein Mal52_17990 [Symmachiella dynata]